MEEKIFTINSVVLGLVILQQVLIVFLIFRVFIYKKRTEQIIQEIKKSQDEVSADQANAMLKLLQYSEQNYNFIFENQKKMQEWMEKNVEAIVSNTSKSINGIEQTQRFLGRMSEALGIVQKSNLQDV